MKKHFLYGLFLATVHLAACNVKTSVKEGTTAGGTANAGQTENSMAAHNKQVIMNGVQAINQHQARDLFKEAIPDMVDYGDGSGPVIRSKDSVTAGMEAFLAAFPDFKIDNPVFVADGDRVILYAENSGTWKGAFMGMQPTGKAFRVRDADIFTFDKEGHITEHRNVQNMQHVFADLGAQIPKQMAMKDNQH